MDHYTNEIKNEIEQLKVAMNSLEERIVKYEDNDNFNPSDIRYTRLVDEKRVLMQNLCDLRSVYSQSTFHLNTPSASTAGQGLHENGFFHDLPSAKRQKLNNSRSFC
jgi:hypothetical protein